MASRSRSILSDVHVQAIGHLVVSVSKLDSLLTDLLAIFAGVTNPLASLAIIHHQQIASKINSLLALVRPYGDKKHSSQVTETLARVATVTDFRNLLVHAHWATDEDGTPVAVKFTARGVLQRMRKRVSATEIRRAADEADELAATLAKLRDHLLSASK